MNDDAGTVHLKDIAARVNADPYIRSSGEDCDAEFVHVCAFPLYLYWGVDSKRLSNVRSELELSFGTQGANGSSQPEAVIKVSIAIGRALDIKSQPALRLISRNTRRAS